MPNWKLWWLPDGSPTGPRWSLVLRGTKGVTYSLPCCPRGFLVRKAWLEDEYPKSPPFPDDIATIIGGVLGIPGCAMPTAGERNEVYAWLAEANLGRRDYRKIGAEVGG